jgi:polyhydroxyalkanoate synthase subunit PhaC
VVRGEKVDVRRIKANLLTVIAGNDHITPACQSETLQDKVASKDKELFRIRGGHIGIMAGSDAARTTWPHIDAWLDSRSGR